MAFSAKFPFLPSQVRPFPVYPVLHVQVYEPAVFWQTALTSQSFKSEIHSLKFKEYAK